MMVSFRSAILVGLAGLMMGMYYNVIINIITKLVQYKITVMICIDDNIKTGLV